MPNRKQKEDKSKPFTTFNILLSIPVSISGTEDDVNIFKKICKEKGIKKPTEYIRILSQRPLKNISGIKNWSELAKKHTPSFEKFHRDLINNYIEFASTEVSDNLSKIIIRQINKEGKRDEKK